MEQIRHWKGTGSIRILLFGDAPAGAPEILQKCSASGRLRDATAQDDELVRSGLGFIATCSRSKARTRCLAMAWTEVPPYALIEMSGPSAHMSEGA
jgi:hypothetical protein